MSIIPCAVKQSVACSCPGMWFSHRKEGSLVHAPPLGEPKNVMLNERSQAQKTPDFMTPFLWNVQNRQTCRERKEADGCQGMGGEEWEVTANRMAPRASCMLGSSHTPALKISCSPFFSFTLSFFLLFSFFFFCGSHLLLARQVLYHWSHYPNPFCFNYFWD
jgi:hypothetical protein